MQRLTLVIDVDIEGHKKTRELGERIGQCALTVLIRAMAWLKRYSPSGSIERRDWTLIEQACQWVGEPDALIAAMIETKWIDEDGPQWRWHDWTHWQAIETAPVDYQRLRREEWRAQQARSRARRRPPPKCPGFDAFWESYPERRKSKRQRAAAELAWDRLAPDAALQAVIVADLQRRVESVGWLKNEGRWIPGGAKYLGERQWELECVIENKTQYRKL